MLWTDIAIHAPGRRGHTGATRRGAHAARRPAEEGPAPPVAPTAKLGCRTPPRAGSGRSARTGRLVSLGPRDLWWQPRPWPRIPVAATEPRNTQRCVLCCARRDESLSGRQSLACPPSQRALLPQRCLGRPVNLMSECHGHACGSEKLHEEVRVPNGTQTHFKVGNS